MAPKPTNVIFRKNRKIFKNDRNDLKYTDDVIKCLRKEYLVMKKETTDVKNLALRKVCLYRASENVSQYDERERERELPNFSRARSNALASSWHVIFFFSVSLRTV